jgi:hypothetical protein
MGCQAGHCCLGAENLAALEVNSMLHITFAVAAVEILVGVATWGEGGGGLEVHMNLMLPRVSKASFFSIYLTFQAAFYGRHKSLPNSSFC